MLRTAICLAILALLGSGCDPQTEPRDVSDRGDVCDPSAQFCDDADGDEGNDGTDTDGDDDDTDTDGDDDPGTDADTDTDDHDDHDEESDLPYDIEAEIGDTVALDDAFLEKGPLPAAVLGVEMEDGDWRLFELQNGIPFVVDQADCDHEGNRDTGRDRAFVTWQNHDGSVETDHIDLRYCGA